jgi:hypothetical protein
LGAVDVEQHSHILLRLLLDCNAIIQPFVALAMHPDCIDSVLNKSPIQLAYLAEAIARATHEFCYEW